MKRKIAVAAGLALLGVGVCLGGRWMPQSRAQQQPGSAPLRTRVAMVNMVQVLRNYSKFKNAEEQLRNDIKQVEATISPKREAFNKVRTEMAGATDASKRSESEHTLRRMQLEIQELEENARKQILGREGDLAVQIYKEVEDVVQQFAKYNDIELVLFYNDAPKEQANDYYSPVNIQRKMMTLNAVMPLYVDARMDITPAITEMLNKRLAAAPTN